MGIKSDRKLYLVGIDSAPLWIVEKLSKNYRMDGFRLFMKERRLFDITSTVPPVTSAAWPTIYTGLDPDEHGVIDFSGIGKDYGKQLLYYDSYKNPPFWNVLASNEYNCLVVTPAVALERSRHRNVDMITGWPLQPRFSSEKIEEVCKRYKYEGEPDIGNALNTGKLSIADATKVYTESTKVRAKLSEYLIDKNNYDMSFVCFTETDRIQHYSLNLDGWEAYVGPVYEQISDFIMYLDNRIRKLDEDAVIMIVSDHGAQQIKYKFLSNSWMVQNNYAVLKDEVYRRKAQKPDSTISNVKKRIVNTLVESKFRREIYSRMPKSLKRIGEKFVEDSFDYETRGKYTRITESDFDMHKTKAFCSVSFGPIGMVFINDSRFSKPCVKAVQREKLKREIIGKLKMLKNVEGKRLMRDVYEGSRYFHNSSNFITPDILFELNENYTADYSGYSKERLYTEPEINRRGEHTSTGIFGVKSYNGSQDIGIRKKGMALSDVSPAILGYFGIGSKIPKGNH